MYRTMDARIDDVSGWAEANGFRFDVADPDDEILSLPLQFLAVLYRSVWNVLQGEWHGVPVEVFDLARGQYSPVMLGQASISTCAVTAMAMDCPELFVTHRSLADAVRDVVTPRIAMESGAFDREWEVWSSDRLLAEAVVHQRMMDWLLSAGATPPRTSFEVRGPWVLAMTEMLRGEDYPILLDDLATFVSFIPHFVLDLYPLQA